MSDAEVGREVEGTAPAEPDVDVARLLAQAGPRPRVPDELTARVRAAVHARWRYRLDARVRRRWMVVALAATVVALAIATLLAWPW